MEATSELTCNGVWEWPATFGRAAQLEQQFRCPLCHSFVTAATTLKCQHMFCSLCIRQALDKEERCPVCRKVASHGDVVRDIRFQMCADVFAAARPSLIEAATRTVMDTEESARRPGAAAKHEPLDLGLAAAAASSIERRRLGAPVYKMKKDGDLRRDLATWGLPSTGTRDEIEFRHRQYINAFNAEQDAPHPRPSAAVVAQVRATERDRVADKAASRAPARAKIDPQGALFVGGGQQRKAAEVITIDDEDHADGGRGGVAASAVSLHAVPASLGHAESATAASLATAPPPAPSSAAAQIAAPDQRPFVTVTGAMREGFVRLREELKVREAARKEQARRAAHRDAATEAGGGSSKSLSSASGDAAAAGDDLRRAIAAAAHTLPDRFRVLYSEVARRPFFFDEESGVGSFEPPPELRYDALRGGLGRLAADASCDSAVLEGRGRAHDLPERPDVQGSEAPAPPITTACSSAPTHFACEAPPKATLQLVVPPPPLPEAASTRDPERIRASQLRPPAVSDAAGAAISSAHVETVAQAPPAEGRASEPTAGLSSSPAFHDSGHGVGVAAALPMQPADQLTAAASVVDSTTGIGATAASPAAVRPASMAPAAPADAQHPPAAAAASGQKRRRSDGASKASTPDTAAAAAAVRALASRQPAGPPASAGPTPPSPAPGASAAASAQASSVSGAAGLATRRGPVAVAAAAALPLVGSWECERCTLTNRRANRKCEVCGHPKAGTAARGAGGAP